MMRVAYFPLFPQNLYISPSFRQINKFPRFREIDFFASPYFYHDAFVPHALLDATWRKTIEQV